MVLFYIHIERFVQGEHWTLCKVKFAQDEHFLPIIWVFPSCKMKEKNCFVMERPNKTKADLNFMKTWFKWVYFYFKFWYDELFWRWKK
jgi:hypothetical protein